MASKDARRASGVRAAALLTPPLLAIALFVAWSQPWVDLTLESELSVEVSGDGAAVVLPALAIASLALTAALAIVSAWWRALLGALLSVLGILAIVVSARAIGDPVIAAAAGVTALTGVEGADSVRALVETAELTAWPVVAVVVGILSTVVGLLIAITARWWPRRTQRFERTNATAAPDADDTIGAWDALSDGRDPTAR